jgi:hypothetical protein
VLSYCLHLDAPVNWSTSSACQQVLSELVFFNSRVLEAELIVAMKSNHRSAAANSMTITMLSVSPSCLLTRVVLSRAGSSAPGRAEDCGRKEAVPLRLRDARHEPCLSISCRGRKYEHLQSIGNTVSFLYGMKLWCCGQRESAAPKCRDTVASLLQCALIVISALCPLEEGLCTQDKQ